MLQQASRNACVLKVSAALMVNISGRIQLCSGEHRKKGFVFSPTGMGDAERQAVSILESE